MTQECSAQLWDWWKEEGREVMSVIVSGLGSVSVTFLDLPSLPECQLQAALKLVFPPSLNLLFPG